MNDSTSPAATPVVNLANILTIARIALVPVFLWLVLTSGMQAAGWRFAACAVFVVASATDYVDGWVARTWDMVTAFGKVADPIADKALTGTALVLLSCYGLVAWWITLVILARELGITLLRLSVLRHGVIPASRGGKIKTALQILAISWYLLPLPDSAAAGADVVMAVAVVVALVTGADYVVRALRLRAGDPGQGGSGHGDVPGGSTRLPVQSQSATVTQLPVPGVPVVQVPAQEEAAS